VSDTTTCAVVGGGPAGLFVGLLLARAGVEVTVFEKHADFLRDFRGDTVHPVTLRLLDELGLFNRFDSLPHSVVEKGQFDVDGHLCTHSSTSVASVGSETGSKYRLRLVG
jgi:2-polyprenyl-6-methoxyphenol hydroxylase-like FAD-dependent oxidoreductase